MKTLERPLECAGTTGGDDGYRVVLPGAGHAHLEVARHAEKFERRVRDAG